MEPSILGVLIGAAVALFGILGTHWLTIYRGAIREKRELNSLLINIDWQLQELDAMTEGGVPVGIGVPGISYIVERGLLSLLPGKLTENLLAIDSSCRLININFQMLSVAANNPTILFDADGARETVKKVCDFLRSRLKETRDLITNFRSEVPWWTLKRWVLDLRSSGTD